MTTLLPIQNEMEFEEEIQMIRSEDLEQNLGKIRAIPGLLV
jgi:hypothetical protein